MYFPAFLVWNQQNLFGSYRKVLGDIYVLYACRAEVKHITILLTVLGRSLHLNPNLLLISLHDRYMYVQYLIKA